MKQNKYYKVQAAYEHSGGFAPSVIVWSDIGILRWDTALDAAQRAQELAGYNCGVDITPKPIKFRVVEVIEKPLKEFVVVKQERKRSRSRRATKPSAEPYFSLSLR